VLRALNRPSASQSSPIGAHDVAADRQGATVAAEKKEDMGSAGQQLLQGEARLGGQSLRIEVAGDDLQGLFDAGDVQVA
jgi:hypothetical protein